MTTKRRGKNRRRFPKGNKDGRQFEEGNDIGRHFEQGNELAIKHGAYSPRKVNDLTREIANVAFSSLDALPYLDDPTFSPAIWAWARAEARVQLLVEYIDEHGMFDNKGRVREAAKQLRLFEKQAAETRRALGLDPTSRARLGADLNSAGFDVAKEWAQQPIETDQEGDNDG